VSAPGDYDNGEIGGIIGKGNRSTRRKPAAVPLCPPQTPHAARTRTRAAAVVSQRLTAELWHGQFLLTYSTLELYCTQGSNQILIPYVSQAIAVPTQSAKC
jgi:hypothetical protein